jgi:hypothetical protein
MAGPPAVAAARRTGHADGITARRPAPIRDPFDTSTAPADPRALVQAPIVAALNGIVWRGVIGFALVAAVAALPLLVRLDDQVHFAVHVALPVGWVAYAVVSTAIALLRPQRLAGDPWHAAAEADSSLAAFARMVTGFMIGGWLASVVGVIVHHHLSTTQDILRTLSTDLPVLLGAWGLASWAWVRASRRSLARAVADSAGRFRSYWGRPGR